VTSSSFSTLALRSELQANLSSLKFTEMTPVQAESLPFILKGHDVIAQAKTGSGKTAAFGLGVLQKLDVKRFRIQSLVLCPTRELADQVAKDLRKLARTIHNIKILTLCGGMPFGPQIGSLEHGAHIIVGTPGRIEEHVRKGTLKLDDVNMLVLDEADRMLDMGFQDVLDDILAEVPKQRQTLLFSATYPEQIESIAKRVMTDPKMVEVKEEHDHSSIEQLFFHVSDHDDRLKALHLVLSRYQPPSTIVFCNTKRETDDVADYLYDQGFSAVALHGDMEQRQRDETLVCFANRSASVLVATDVAARGLDIDQLDAVVNFHIAIDPEVHTHRIGRTGRAGAKGQAFSFFSNKEGNKILRMDLDSDPIAEPNERPADSFLKETPIEAPMATLQIDGGKKQKVRPGDILGALTGGDRAIDGKDVGKINVFDQNAYIAVKRSVASQALKIIERGKLKGRNFRVRLIRG
jgi:ATP-independent RNA helicase DbpA